MQAPTQGDARSVDEPHKFFFVLKLISRLVFLCPFKRGGGWLREKGLSEDFAALYDIDLDGKSSIAYIIAAIQR